jgi:hypothetical protein
MLTIAVRCGKAATKLREAFGVRGACSRFRTIPPYDSNRKLPALQTIRVAVRAVNPLQLVNNSDYCRARPASVT